MGLLDVVADGDRLLALRELRDRVAAELDASKSARDVAALSQRLMDVLAQIEQIEQARSAPRSNARDEVARKRAERASKAPRPRRAAGRAQ
jgi:hypothetical protein